MDLDSWVLEGTRGQMTSFAAALTETRIDEAGGSYRLFGAAGGNAPAGYYAWPILGGKHKTGFTVRAGSPLFSGRAKARPLGPAVVQQGAASRWSLKVELALNPTRWLRSQDINLVRVSEEEWGHRPPRMFAHENLSFEEEVPLVEGTNVLMGSRRLLALAMPRRWPINLRRYWTGTNATLNAAFAQAASASGMRIVSRPRFTIKEIETYWEFASQRPLEDVRALEAPMRALAARSHVRFQPLAAGAKSRLPWIESGSEDNSPSIRLKIMKGLQARIYAKTSHRIRFEVIHDCKKTMRRFTSHQPEALLPWLSNAATDAAGRLNTILDLYRHYSVAPTTGWPAIRLVNYVLWSSSDTTVASTILDILVNQGNVVRKPNDPSASAIDLLKEEDVLVRMHRSGSDQIYTVTERYRSALAALRMEPPAQDWPVDTEEEHISSDSP